MSGIFQHGMCIFFQTVDIPLTGRTVKHSCLAETASTDTATLDLKNHPVLRGLDKRYDRLLRIRCIRHIHDDLLPDDCRCVVIYRSKRL